MAPQWPSEAEERQRTEAGSTIQLMVAWLLELNPLAGVLTVQSIYGRKRVVTVVFLMPVTCKRVVLAWWFEVSAVDSTEREQSRAACFHRNARLVCCKILGDVGTVQTQKNGKMATASNEDVRVPIARRKEQRTALERAARRRRASE